MNSLVLHMCSLQNRKVKKILLNPYGPMLVCIPHSKIKAGITQQSMDLIFSAKYNSTP